MKAQDLIDHRAIFHAAGDDLAQLALEAINGQLAEARKVKQLQAQLEELTARLEALNGRS